MKKKEFRSALKKTVAFACSLALGAALVPAAAVSAFAADDPVLSVVMQDAKTGSVITLKKGKFTQAQLDELAAKNTGTVNYLYNAKGETVFSTNKYVTLDQLLGCVGDKWAPGSTITFASGTFTGQGAWSYEDVTAEQYFYGGYTTKDGITGEATAVSTVVALNIASSKFDSETQTASDIVASFEESDYSSDDAPRDFMGLAKGATDLLAGKGSVTGIDTITVTYPHEDFQVLTRNATTGEEAVVATYTDEQLEALAAENKGNMSYLFGSGIYTATSYVTVDQLLSDVAKWEEGASLEVNTPDNFASTISYADVTGAQYFYPEYSSTEASANNAVEVKAAIALKYKAASLTDASTAADAAAASLENEDAEGAPRWMRGNTDVANILRGNASPQNICKMTVIYTPVDLSAATVTASDKTYNGKKQTVAPKVVLDGKTLAEGTDYTVSGNAQTKAGSYTLTVTGKGDYAGTATGEFSIKQASNKVTVKVAKKAYKAKAVKKAKKTFSIGGKATFGTVKYSVAYKAKKAGVSVSSKGKVTVKKGTKKGTYKVTVKVAKTANWKAASKTVKVIVK